MPDIEDPAADIEGLAAELSSKYNIPVDEAAGLARTLSKIDSGDELPDTRPAADRSAEPFEREVENAFARAQAASLAEAEGAGHHQDPIAAILTSQLGVEDGAAVYRAVLDTAALISEVVGESAEPGLRAAQVLSARARNEARLGAVREQLLEGARTAQEVADLLGVSPQAVDQRRQRHQIVALKDRGRWRYPSWQFDLDAPDPLPQRLPEIAEAAGNLRLAVVRWLREVDEILGARPIDVLRDGDWAEAVTRARQLFVTAT